jgi:hypothetical protein
MHKISKAEIFFISILSIIVVSASLFQLYLFLRNTTSGMFSPLIHNYLQDYYYYLSYIKQGMDGKWLVTARFSPEIFPPQFVFTFYPLIGAIGALFKMPVYIIYFTARAGSAVLLLVLSYLLSGMIFRSIKQRLLVFFFIVFGVPFWYMKGSTFGMYGEFWTGFDPFLRVAFLPHHIFAVCMLVLSLIFLIRATVKNDFRFAFLGGLTAGVGVWCNAAIFFALVPAVLIAFFLDIRKFKQNLKFTLIFTIIPAIPVYFLYRLSNSVFPWTTFSQWESRNFYPLPSNIQGIIAILGVTSIFSILSIYFVLRKGNFAVKLILGWFVSIFIGLMVFQKYLPVSNIRYIQSAYYIPTAILSVYMFSAVLKYFRKKKAKVQKLVFIFLSAVIFVASTYPSFQSSMDAELKSVNLNKYSPLIYIPQDFMDVLNWLDKNGKYDEVVLSDSVSSPLIPAFTNKRVVYGHPILTFNVQERVSDIYSFYSLQSYEQSKNILIKDNVSYIIDWPKHPLLSTEFLSQIKAKKAYENNSYIIYKVAGNQ